MIVCPGGGFHFLSIEHEGTDVAAWLTARGLTAFVLKYRLLRTGDDFATEVWRNLGDPQRMAELMKPLRRLLLADGQQAVRLVRQRAAEWGIHSDRIGLLGLLRRRYGDGHRGAPARCGEPARLRGGDLRCRLGGYPRATRCPADVRPVRRR